jgi:hypothetical protein
MGFTVPRNTLTSDLSFTSTSQDMATYSGLGWQYYMIQDDKWPINRYSRLGQWRVIQVFFSDRAVGSVTKFATIVSYLTA